MKKCPNCGNLIQNDLAKFCGKCGTKQPEIMNTSSGEKTSFSTISEQFAIDVENKDTNAEVESDRSIPPTISDTLDVPTLEENLEVPTKKKSLPTILIVVLLLLVVCNFILYGWIASVLY